MGEVFRELGKVFGRAADKLRWIRSELTGTKDDAIEAEHRFGRDLARTFEEELPAASSPENRELLKEVGGRLTSSLKNRRRRFVFSILPRPEVNAFALPGGFVYVTEFLLTSLGPKPDNLAFVLGHEMSHILRGHAWDRMLNSALLSSLSAAMPASTAWHVLCSRIVKQFVSNAYSQDRELEADRYAVRLAERAGFEPAASIDVLEQLAKLGGKETALSEYFSSHPPVSRRIAEIKRLLAE